MKTKFILTFGILVLIVAGGYWYWNSNVLQNGTYNLQSSQVPAKQLIPYTDDAQFKLSYPPEYSDIHTSGSPSLGVTSFARKDGSGILVAVESVKEKTSCYLGLCDTPPFKRTIANGLTWDYVGSGINDNDGTEPSRPAPRVYRTLQGASRIYIEFPAGETRIQEVLNTFAFIK